MYKMDIIDCKEPLQPDFYQELKAFDFVNMNDILVEAGLVFEEEKRYSFLKAGEYIVTCRDNNNVLIGYIEFGNHGSTDIMYITSYQVLKKYRLSPVSILLIAYMMRHVKDLSFEHFECHVHKTNAHAIKLYKKMGFRFCEYTDKQYHLQVEKDIMNSHKFNTIYKRVFKTEENLI